MIYAQLESLTNGLDSDRKNAKKLQFNTYYEVERVEINSSITYVKLKVFDNYFNSVNLKFFSDTNGTPYDIFSNKDYYVF